MGCESDCISSLFQLWLTQTYAHVAFLLFIKFHWKYNICLSRVKVMKCNSLPLQQQFCGHIAWLAKALLHFIFLWNWKIKAFLYQKSIEIKMKLFQYNMQYLEREEKLNKDLSVLSIGNQVPIQTKKWHREMMKIRNILYEKQIGASYCRGINFHIYPSLEAMSN